MLRNCLPQNVRRVLRDLPASLDETYERMLKEVLKANPDQVYYLLQCLTVSTRPLRVDELAEVLALDFDAADDGIPVPNKGWLPDDGEQGVLSVCSSLIVVVDGFDYNVGRKTRAVQFAHFSVKEFLTSDRLADIKADISRFYIRLEPAHTVIARVCLATLLQSDHDDGENTTPPLTKYAAQHWVGHAHFGNVPLCLEVGMQRLFDPAKPYFIAWLNSYDFDIRWKSFLQEDSNSLLNWGWEFISAGEEDAPLCLYYAALCGFGDLTKYLINKYPQLVNAAVGLNKSPLSAALCNRHIKVAEILHQHGAVLPIGLSGRTLLHAASADGLVDVAQWLINIGADPNAQDDGHRTPLHFAAANGRLELVHILLGHGVDVNAAAGTDNPTPLHDASLGGHVNIMRLLIEQGADVHVKDQSQSTPLHLAWNAGAAQLLIEHGADVHARDQCLSTPLHLASTGGNVENVQLLIKHGADVHARDESQSTPLHLALPEANARTAQLLIEHGADVHAQDQSLSTPLHLVRDIETAQLLVVHGADVHARDQSQSTPLHIASSRGYADTVQLLVEHGADVHARDQHQSTPLHMASSSPSFMNAETTVRLLIEQGASVNACDKNHKTPLHRVSSSRIPNADSLCLLLENGADVDVEDDKGLTAFQIALAEGHGKIAQLLLGRRASIVSGSM
jgi:ankyrin repeat protein